MKDFELKAFKIGLTENEVKYRLVETSADGTVDEKEYHVKLSKPAHPDLMALFKNLHDVAAVVFEELVEIGELDEPKLLPTGIVFAGKGENKGISITGERTTKYGRATWKIPRIKYLSGQSTVDMQLTVFADAISQEVYSYLFENKVARMQIIGE